MTNDVSRADLHIHSRFSDRPAEWLLRRLGFSGRCSRPAGSDDHGGMFPASAFTETERVGTPAEFLRHLRAGCCAARGAGGTPLALSHGLYNTIYAFIGDKFLK